MYSNFIISRLLQVSIECVPSFTCEATGNFTALADEGTVNSTEDSVTINGLTTLECKSGTCTYDCCAASPDVCSEGTFGSPPSGSIRVAATMWMMVVPLSWLLSC